MQLVVRVPLAYNKQVCQVRATNYSCLFVDLRETTSVSLAGPQDASRGEARRGEAKRREIAWIKGFPAER